MNGGICSLTRVAYKTITIQFTVDNLSQIWVLMDGTDMFVTVTTAKNTKHTSKTVIELAGLINYLHTQFSSITFLSLASFSFIIKSLSYAHETKSYPFLEKEKPTITYWPLLFTQLQNKKLNNWVKRSTINQLPSRCLT